VEASSCDSKEGKDKEGERKAEILGGDGRS